MKRIRTLVAATLVATATLTLPASAYAAGKAPAGNGLGLLTGQTDIHLSNLACDDAGVTDMLVARGGNAGWVVGTDGMYVLQSISGTGTVTFPGGQETYEFSQDFGNKSGRTQSLSCEAHYRFDGGDVVDAGHMEWTLVKIW